MIRAVTINRHVDDLSLHGRIGLVRKHRQPISKRDDRHANALGLLAVARVSDF
jgi:hypothetical protein